MIWKKIFAEWFILKPQLQNTDKSNIYFKERDIWWCSLGVNLGDKEDGKNEQFNRPVLILRKFNKNIFYGLPMTTRIKDNPYYLQVSFHDRQVSVMLSQMRLFDRKRLQRKIGQLDKKDFEITKESFKGLC